MRGMQRGMSRLVGKESAALDERIYEAALDGLSAASIAERLGVPKSSVQRRMAKMVRSGRLPRAVDRRGYPREYKLRLWAREARLYRAVKLGPMSRIFELLTDEQVKWLYDNTLDGGEVVTFLASIVRDAYADEHMHPADRVAELLKRGEK